MEKNSFNSESASLTEEVSRVKVSHDQGLANQIGPELCAGGSNPPGEALAGERAGRVLSHEKRINFRAPTRSNSREGHTATAQARAGSRLCGVGDPSGQRPGRTQTGRMPARTDSGTGRAQLCPPSKGTGRIGKSKDASR